MFSFRTLLASLLGLSLLLAAVGSAAVYADDPEPEQGSEQSTEGENPEPEAEDPEPEPESEPEPEEEPTPAPDGVWHYTWDTASRMTRAESGTYAVDYWYDASGQRIRQVDNAGMQIDSISDRYEVEGDEIRQYLFVGDRRIATLTSNGSTETMAYHHEDHLTGASVDTDATGNILLAVDYLPYGSTRVEQSNPDHENRFRFTGQEQDTTTGLYYYDARYYDPSIGRFISQDPWAGRLMDPQTLNKYSYVLNNPMKYKDPTGEKVEIAARALNVKGGGVGVHTFLIITPDNPSAFGLDHSFSFTIGAYDGEDNKDGKLDAQINNETDVNWGRDNLKEIQTITTPEGMSDAEFINAILNSYGWYEDDKEYSTTSYGDGKNCNDFTTSLLQGAGSDIPEGFDPAWAANPGLGSGGIGDMSTPGSNFNWFPEFNEKVLQPENQKDKAPQQS